MPINKGKRPAARGPLAKVAISRGCEFSYTEIDPDEGKLILERKGFGAVEAFNHPDFDKKKFDVCEWGSESHSSKQTSKPRRSWGVTSHVLRDGVVIRKCFNFRCGTALAQIRELARYEKAAKNPGIAKKTLEDRAGVL
jgi:hypothetical protein